jgi:quercetin dioxygenase-like cupin family protein
MFVNKEQLFVDFESIAWEERGGGVRRKVLAYSDALMAVYVAFAKGAVGAPHHHPHLQVTHVQSGVFLTRIGAESRTLRQGDVFFVPSGVEHGVEALEAGVLIDVFTPMREDFLPKTPGTPA